MKTLKTLDGAILEQQQDGAYKCVKGAVSEGEMLIEAKMNADKMVPIDFSRNITPFVMGDNYYSPLLGRDNCTMSERDVQMFNRGEFDNCGYFITSFADRSNEGSQPVGDDVVVDVVVDCYVIGGGFITAKACDFIWENKNRTGCVETWKPNHAAMLKQYQAEQLEQDHHIALQADVIVSKLKENSAIKTLEQLNYSYNGAELWKPPIGKAPTFIVTPTLTQAMADSGEVPSVGAICQYKLKGGVNWFDCRVVHYHNSHAWIENLTTGSSPLIKINTLSFKPIQTEEDKLRSAMINELVDPNESGWEIDRAKSCVDDLLTSDKFTITLNK
jgi:hypothetical protein